MNKYKEYNLKHGLPIGSKVCPKCNKRKSYDEFSKNICRKDGRTVYCIPCWNTFYKKMYKGSVREKHLNKFQTRYKNDLDFKLYKRLYTSFRKLFNVNDGKFIMNIVLGCSMDEFKQHLESQFVEGMSWENYGKVWHIDHIIPIRLFKYKNEKEKLKCLHYSNTSPIFAKDNISKGDKMPNGQLARYLDHSLNKTD